MKLVVGVMTCNRFKFTKAVVESILKFMPELYECSWCFSDDNSIDGTIEYLHSLDWHSDGTIVYHPERVGIIQNYYDLWENVQKFGDIALLLSNDFICTRRIDIDGILGFFKSRPCAGQVRLYHYKGRPHKKERECSMTNWVTWKPIVGTGTFRAGSEKLHRANWNYTQLVNITRLGLGVDMFDGLIPIPKDWDFSKGEYDEALQDKNFQKTGLEIYEIKDQPFWHLDHDSKNKTKRSRR